MAVSHLYVPLKGLEPRCRCCWGLSYESQSWSYKRVGIFGRVLGPIAYATTNTRRQKKRQRALDRYTARRSALATAARAAVSCRNHAERR